MKSIKHLLLLMFVVLLSSCATTSSKQYVILIMPEKGSNTDDFVREETYSEFASSTKNSFSKNAYKLWGNLCASDTETAYTVSYGSRRIAVNDTKYREWRHHFKDPNIGNKAGCRLNILYIDFPENIILAHAQITAIADYKQRRELAMVKKEYSDAIAIFKTKEFGPDILVVARSMAGPKKLHALITIHSIDTSEAAKKEMVARIQSLTKEDLFPIDLVRYKAEENLRDVQLQIASVSVNKETFANECAECATLLQTNDKVAHVIVKTDKDAENMKYVLSRPLIGETVETQTRSIKSMKESELCVGCNSLLPGEQMKLTIQDSRGIELENYSFVPNPIVLSSALDDGKIEFEILNSECYVIKGRMEGKVEFESACYNEKINQTIDDFNIGSIYYQPGVIGKSGGIAHLKFKRESGEELKISLPWGTALNI